ncbi:MAG: endonuclease/exonuclease/phosphatase family protein [Calditrichaeota bacterium]|nr:endonuclease/exonuclease/phosphatase family protein [Calditrichota bacterium]MCB9086907.1 endonuclease/exonuclease/phosphatase family protein [Calditrichia bacterium]
MARTNFFHSTLLLLFLSGQLLIAQPQRILVDGTYGDWDGVALTHNDPLGDPLSGSLDFGRLWVTNDEDYLFIRIEVGQEINLQDLNGVTLFLDSDLNPATGYAINGIGAELQWRFGDRSGFYYRNGATLPVSHAALGIVTAPTVTSTVFEIALERQARPDGSHLLFEGDQIALVFQDRFIGGDLLPDNGGAPYSFNNDPLPARVQIPIRPLHSNTIRLMSYNVLSDGFFVPSRQPSFARILQALQPAIIGFQEIYDHDATQVRDAVAAILPGQQWYGAGIEPDIFAVSRYPISSSFAIEGTNSSNQNGAFLLDLRPQFDSDLLFIVAHTPCCTNNTGRQYEIDAIMAFIREARAPGGELTLEPNTPIVITGDMNLVGDAQQLTTLLTGEIINTNPFGPSFSPDWDGSDFSDLLPRHTLLPMTFSWYSPSSTFSPGRLDAMIYSDSVIEPLQSFLLFTPALSADTLAAYGLLAGDATTASDHLPVVGDFRLSGVSGLPRSDREAADRFWLGQNYPNPFNPRTVIRYQLSVVSDVSLTVYDLLGRRMQTLVTGRQAAGIHTVQWDGRDARGRAAASGIYSYELRISAPGAASRETVLRRKMVLIR